MTIGVEAFFPSKTSQKAQNGQVSTFRRIFPQVLAATAKNLLLLDLGMTLALPTLAIPALLDDRDTRHLNLTAEAASWFGSVGLVCQPLGSVLSGFVLEPLGRKKAMMLVNLPHITAWLMAYFADSTTLLYLAAVIFGFGVGFMEAPIITYVSEIAEPRLRGTLTSYSNLFSTFGIFLIYLLGSVLEWRTVALVSAAVPILTILALSQVPETPLWLVGRGRDQEAESSLRWLRGWVGAPAVAAELAELKTYNQQASARRLHLDQEEAGCWEKVKDFCRPEMMKPLFLVVGFFFFSCMTGVVSSRPYMVLMFQELEFPVNPYHSTVVFGSVGFCGSVLCMCTVASFGKRPIALSSMGACCLAGLVIGITPHLITSSPTLSWLRFIAFMIVVFATFYGANGIIWTIVGEVMPFRGRGLGSGLAAASFYIFAFSSTKTYPWLVEQMGLDGLFILYGVVSAVGLIFLVVLLPETEGRTLQDIEESYTNRPFPVS